LPFGNRGSGCNRRTGRAAFHLEYDGVSGHGGNRQRIGDREGGAGGIIGAEHVIHVDRVELPILHLDVDRDLSGRILGHREFIMHHLGGARRDLVVVKRREDVLRIAPVDAVAIPVQHVSIDEVRPGIDIAVRAHPAVAADHLVSAADARINPEFIGIDGALRQRVPQLERAQDYFQQIALSSFQSRQLRAQRRSQGGVHRPAFLDPEDVHADGAFHEVLLCAHGIGIAAECCDPGVGCGEEVVVDAQHMIGGIEELRSEIIDRGLERHMAAVAVLLRFLRVIKAAGLVPRHTAEQVSIVMILPSQELFIVVELVGNADLVAGRAELRALMQVLQERLLVELRFGFDKLLVDELQQPVGAEREWIVDRFFDGVIRIAPRAVHVGDRVASRAGDPRLRSGMFLHIEVRIIEGAAKERHDIMAAGTPTRGFDVAVSF